MTTLLRDVIAIPERAGEEDYVLKLTEGVGSGRLVATVEQYVVTDAIAEAFDSALGLVAAAVRDGRSRAAFLSGSFGSGKSHFMAVLHALLGPDGEARTLARSKRELAPVVPRYDADLENRRVVRLAYHFLEARSVEETVLGGYVAQIQALHPGCDLPAVHRGDAVLADGENMRGRVGDDAFLAALNQHGAAAAADVWAGVLEGADTWTAQTYDEARAAPAGSERRQQLVSALVRTYFTAYTNTAEFVSLDEGLAAVTRHAKSLGYDAVVMFLDELVLWLSFLVRDRQRFSQEAQKITKLVEAQHERPIPVVSFVARQMNLRRYFTEAGGGLGAEQEALDKAFSHQEGRFSTIVLGDDNLPYVAHRRLLQPIDAAARAVLGEAFGRLERRPEVWDVLLDGANTDGTHRGADQLAFRLTYPFSPALVSTLRTLASAMQRDRTALKVMQQLLVRRRDTLTVDDVVPVGDVFDLVIDGNQALTPDMAGRFAGARKLYSDKLRPLLLREHALAAGDIAGLPPTHPFHADDRLVKTLVLSAVAPEVPALKELTAGRLAALNHGSIVSPLPGQEATVVLGKIRRWSGDVPEVHVTGDNRNPVIRVRIAEVDYESVVERARGEDNDGRRREMLKRLVWKAFDLSDAAPDAFGVSRQARVWRGSRRDVEVVFGNVCDRSWLTDDAFQATEGTWRFVVDYPFDEQGRSARDDLERLDELRSRGGQTRTVVWLPRFLSRERRDELGRLVILDWLLSRPGERWTSHADNLAEAERAQARSILEAQRDSLWERMRRTVQESYGAATATPGTLDDDEAHDRVLVSLHPELQPAAPVGHDLEAAFENLIDQAFTATYPGHPRFEPDTREVRGSELAAVLNAVESARQDRDGTTFVEAARREAIRRVANPLGVGHMGENNYLFSADRFRWDGVFSVAMGRAGLSPTDVVDVGTLRSWIDDAEPRQGLRPEVGDLVICTWAVLHNRAWYRGGSPWKAVQPGQLAPDMQLRPEAMPTSGDWEIAFRRAGVLFGIMGNGFLTGSSVAELAADVRAMASAQGAAATAVAEQVTKAYQRLRLGTDPAAGRLATAVAARDLVAALRTERNTVALVERLARTELDAPDEAVARSLSTAGGVAGALEGHAWQRLDAVLAAEGGADEKGRGAKAVLDRLRAAVTADELAQSLPRALKRADDEAFAWALLPAPIAPPTPTPTPPAPQSPPPPAGSASISSDAELAAAVDQVRAFAADHPGERVTVQWRVE